MKAYLKKIYRFISDKPIIGWPVRFIMAVLRLPQTRVVAFDNSHQIKQINEQISYQAQQLNEVNSRINDIYHRINEINDQVNWLKQRLDEYDTRYVPDLLESLEYQENLKKSLPVVLRQYRRAILKTDK